MRAGNGLFLFLVSLLVFGVSRVCSASTTKGLQMNFYKKSCKNAENIVKRITRNRVQSNPVLPAKLIRLHFHDCFVRGCDASVLLDATNNTRVEKDTVPNQTLSGFDVIDDIKTEIEKACPGIVSCADILTLATRDALSFPSNKDMWKVPTGRRDGRISLASEVTGNIPSPFSSFSTLQQLFISKGLNNVDLVALSGAHTIGVAHCGTFSRRLYNFTGKGDADPTLDATYARFLRTKCPNPANPATTVVMDPPNPLTFDRSYFTLLLQNKGLFQSDAELLKNPSSLASVRKYQRSNSFFDDFAASMTKLGAVGVLTGTNGEIRKQCHVAN